MKRTREFARGRFVVDRRWAIFIHFALRVALAASLAWTPQLAAGELPSVVVTGARLPQTDPEAVPSVDILLRSEIEARQPRTSVELIRELPGVWADQPGGPGGLSSVYVRGADPNFTLVMIDGVRINDVTNSRGGSFDISSISPQAIERIEVVRGVRSAAYGSDALAGVVNIITVEGADTPRASIESAFGTDGYRRIGAQLAGPLNNVSAAVTAGATDYGESDAGAALEVRHATAKVETDFGSAARVSLFGRLAGVEASSHPDDSGGRFFAERRALEDRDATEFSGGVRWDHTWSDTVASEVRFDGSQRDETVNSPGVAPGLRDPFGIPANRFSSTHSNMGASAALRVRLAPTVRTAAGVEWRQEQGESDSLLQFDGFELPGRFDLQRSIRSAFAEFEWRPIQRVTLEAAARIDDADGWSAQTSQSAAVRYELYRLDGTLFVRWGEGFKLPSFFALGNPLVGNPQLEPEESRAIEAGMRFAACAHGCIAELSIFQNRYRNLVDFEEGPPPRLVNRSAARTRGIESRFEIDLTSRANLALHATYVDAELVGLDEKLRNRPQWQGGAGMRLDLNPALLVSVQALYVGELHDSSIPTGDVVLDDYIRADLGITWTPSSNWRLQLAIDNLNDASEQEAVGIPALGRNARLAAQYSF